MVRSIGSLYGPRPSRRQDRDAVCQTGEEPMGVFRYVALVGILIVAAVVVYFYFLSMSGG
jgi:hypothetical protein